MGFKEPLEEPRNMLSPSSSLCPKGSHAEAVVLAVGRRDEEPLCGLDLEVSGFWGDSKRGCGV